MPGPRRTREQVIASQSQNYVEKFFIDKGHTVSRPQDDYGTDLLVKTFDKQGYEENGDIRLQLKARSKFSYTKDGSHISLEIEVKHYHSWVGEPYPFFLVLYDATKTKAYYLYLQEYFTSGTPKKPKKNAKSMRVRVPVKNEFTSQTVDYMQERKAAFLKQIQGKIKHEA